MKGLYFILTALFVNFGLLSQSDETGVIAKIKSLDKEFWSDYNNCQIATLKNHLDEQIEFYHDKGGMLVGADNLVNSIKKNLCSVKIIKSEEKCYPIPKISQYFATKALYMASSTRENTSFI